MATPVLLNFGVGVLNPVATFSQQIQTDSFVELNEEFTAMLSTSDTAVALVGQAATVVIIDGTSECTTMQSYGHG